MNFQFPPRKVLLPVDTIESSARAFAFGLALKEKFGTRLEVLHAQHFEPPPYFSSGQVESLKKELQRSIRAAEHYYRSESTRALGFEPEIRIAEAHPAEAILAAAKDPEVDLVVMATHGRSGAGRFLMGSVAEGVLRSTPKPTLVVRLSGLAPAFREILCPILPGEPASTPPVYYAARLAGATGGRLRVLRLAGADALECPPVPAEILKGCRVEESTRQGDPASSILAEAETGATDLIVMGAPRSGGTLAGLFSNPTETVMQRAESSLLVVPAN